APVGGGLPPGGSSPSPRKVLPLAAPPRTGSSHDRDPRCPRRARPRPVGPGRGRVRAPGPGLGWPREPGPLVAPDAALGGRDLGHDDAGVRALLPPDDDRGDGAPGRRRPDERAAAGTHGG